MKEIEPKALILNKFFDRFFTLWPRYAYLYTHITENNTYPYQHNGIWYILFTFLLKRKTSKTLLVDLPKWFHDPTAGLRFKVW